MAVPAVAAALLLLAGGCVDDGGTNPELEAPGSAPPPDPNPPAEAAPDPSQQVFTVDASGGTVNYRSTEHDVSLILTFPPDALAETTEITVEHARAFPSAAGLVTGAVFKFGPDGLDFNAPVGLSINYTMGMVGAVTEDDLRIHQAVGANWIPLLGAVDKANKSVAATLSGFSTYGLKTIPPIRTGGDTWVTIQSEILQPRCVGCHNNTQFAPMGLSWEADQYERVVTNGLLGNSGGFVAGVPIIEPRNSAGSALIWKLNGEDQNGDPVGTRMPATGPPYLTEAEVDRIAAWIDAGALGAGGGGAPAPGDGDGGSAPAPGDGGGGSAPAPGDGGGGGGTGGGGTGGGGGTSDPSTIVPTWYGVQTNILERFCVGCHFNGPGAPMGLSWAADQYDAVVSSGRMSGEIPSMAIVAPGDPAASYMYWKINGQGPTGQAIQGVRMPATGIPLDPSLIAVIEQWIADGAPLGVPADADAGGDGGSGGSSEPSFPVGSWMYVWTESLQICTFCHSATPASPRCGVDFDCPPKDVVLTSDNYFGVVDDSIVRPFRPDNSELWDRVTDPDPDKRMPFEMAPLNQTQLIIIQDWIEDGAPFCPSGEVCP